MPVTEADLAPFLSVTESAMRTRLGTKWTKYPSHVLPAWVADMDFPIAPNIRDALVHAIDRGDIGYPPDDGRLAEAFTAWVSRRWGWNPDPSRITVMPDILRPIDRCIELLTSPGDRVLVTTPIYPPFLQHIAKLGREAMELPLTADGYRIDWSALRLAPPAVVLLCNPHNPTGRVLSREELETVAGLGVPIISDEIHADLVYPGSRHIPTASLSDEVAARTITVAGASKAFNLAGLRCALMTCGSDELHERLTVAHDTVGTLGIAATMAALTPAGEEWLAACMTVLDRNRHTVADWAASRGLGHQMPQATYLAWLDFRPVGGPDDVSDWLIREAHVALSPGLDFGEPGRGHARLNFATSPALLGEVLGRIGGALDRLR